MHDCALTSINHIPKNRTNIRIKYAMDSTN